MKWQKDQEKKGRPRAGCGILGAIFGAGIGGCLLILLSIGPCGSAISVGDDPSPVAYLTAAVLVGTGAILITLAAILHMLLDIAWRQWRTHERPTPKKATKKPQPQPPPATRKPQPAPPPPRG